MTVYKSAEKFPNKNFILLPIRFSERQFQFLRILQKVVACYLVGAQVMVFYNPQNPSDAVLETKAPAQWIMWLILIVFDIALCGVIPIIWWSMNQ